MNNGKIVTISSVKGGVGKTTMALNLAGLYYLMKKKVLIIDLDLFAGGVATCLGVNVKKDIYMLVDALSNNKQAELSEYVANYNSGIRLYQKSGSNTFGGFITLTAVAGYTIDEVQ